MAIGNFTAEGRKTNEIGLKLPQGSDLATLYNYGPSPVFIRDSFSGSNNYDSSYSDELANGIHIPVGESATVSYPQYPVPADTKVPVVVTVGGSEARIVYEVAN